MVRIITPLFGLLAVVYVAADFSNFYLCPNSLENDEASQAAEKPVSCIPVYSPDFSAEDVAQIRRKRSSDDEETESWQLPRDSRGRQIKTVHLSSPFTPRLGRRGAGYRLVGAGGEHSPSQAVINLSPGSGFTPRLGRRTQGRQMK